jgi:pyruvate,water dikinase
MEAKAPIIGRGISVSPGIIEGPVKIVDSPEDVYAVKQGDIVVVKYSNPLFTLAVMASAGLICEVGGVLTHICIVSAEIGIPCIARAENITESLADGMIITLDASQGLVYGSHE